MTLAVLGAAVGDPHVLIGVDARYLKLSFHVEQGSAVASSDRVR